MNKTAKYPCSCGVKLCSSINSPIYPSSFNQTPPTHPYSTSQFIHPSIIHSLTHPLIYVHLHPSTIDLFIHLFIHSSIHLNHSSPFIHLALHLSIHLPILPFTYKHVLLAYRVCAWDAEINNSGSLLSENSESTEGDNDLNDHYTKSLY